MNGTKIGEKGNKRKGPIRRNWGKDEKVTEEVILGRRAGGREGSRQARCRGAEEGEGREEDRI